jgi:hypothetical protein
VGADIYTHRLKDFCTIYFLDFLAIFWKLYVIVVAKVFSIILAIVAGVTRTQFLGGRGTTKCLKSLKKVRVKVTRA